jgi:hypothetical protein
MERTAGDEQLGQTRLSGVPTRSRPVSFRPFHSVLRYHTMSNIVVFLGGVSRVLSWMQVGTPPKPYVTIP